MIAQAMWTHGHSIRVEFPDRVLGEWHAGFYTRIVGKQGTSNWFHFAVPTPVIMFNNRLNIDAAMIRFRSSSGYAIVTNIHVFDGENRIAAHDGLSLAPGNWEMYRFNVPGKPEIHWGIGISIGASFNSMDENLNGLEFSAAGVDFLP